ncbi:unnamed protein product [Nesidiocoris tenuis]|uniref:Uncharacterized protein n=1 Tax=Nesidiocoris tenuis TaxID=355587 RepID=A0A6H5H356_9HEMI|nr:unnamed protein product [Nesidiocoris tenuis]
MMDRRNTLTSHAQEADQHWSPSYQPTNTELGKSEPANHSEASRSIKTSVSVAKAAELELAQAKTSVSDSVETPSPAHRPKPAPEPVPRVNVELPQIKDAKIVIYICAADSQGQSDNSYLIPLVFLNSYLGTPLLPKTLENADFQTVTSEERSGLLLKCFHRWAKPVSVGCPATCRPMPNFSSAALTGNASKISRTNSTGPMPNLYRFNTRKFAELPYQMNRADNTALNLTLNHEWILNKLCATDASQVIEDTFMENPSDDIVWLRGFLTDNADSLTYDGRQLYSQVYRYVKQFNTTTLSNVWKRISYDPPITSLLEADCNEKGANGFDGSPAYRNHLRSRWSTIANASYFATASSTLTIWTRAFYSPNSKEVVDNTPNYIVVYDLQSGTLFKKWKPAVSTTSLEISHAESCLVSGHQSSKILSWSLGTDLGQFLN